MILGSVAFGSVMALLAGVLTVVYLHERPRCSEQVLSESLGPDSQWIATSMQRRCGEDSPFLVHVNVRPAKSSVQLGYFSGAATEGEIFVAEQDSPDVVPEVAWTGPSALTIRCRGCRDAEVHKRAGHIGGIAVHYDLQP